MANRKLILGSSLFGSLLILLTLLSCNKKEAGSIFVVRENHETGLDFVNKIVPRPDFNMMRYMYFYNGGGVGAGDFNNDGLTDLFFSSNQGRNTLYLNRGKLKFEDVTDRARIPFDSAWNTGVSLVDINNDGLLDIYICRVGDFEVLKSKNQLLVCQGLNSDGIPAYKDEAEQYGLAFSGFSTQAGFFDYDLDGDLDMYLLNHSVHQNESYSAREKFAGTYDARSGDRLYRNEGGRFVDVTSASGILASSIGYGLGMAIADINLDGYPDLYIGNDFHENDYLYINQKNGTFSEESGERLMHTSQFSMGVDIGDINNDAFPEIISMDMLPSDPEVLKRSLGDDSYDVYQMKIRFGYNHQYARNNLQFNRRNGMFSEIGQYAGVDATDWSWAPLWVDFDNDGFKDLFVSSGIQKRLNDIDYIQYISNAELQTKILKGEVDKKEMDLIDKFPEIKIPNKFYKNSGNLSFQDLHLSIKNDKNTYSNGAVYADFDNDGDLDVVVNNANQAALLYENRTNTFPRDASLSIHLKGSQNNIRAVGTKVLLFSGSSIRSYEKFPTRGFQSSMDVPMHLGLTGTVADSLLVIWPDNSFEKIFISDTTRSLSLSYREGLPAYPYLAHIINPDSSLQFYDAGQQVKLQYHHKENNFVEFDRESLLPHTLSDEGPALAVGDMNNDKRDDVFIGASRGKKSKLFVQHSDGTFRVSPQPALDNDSTYEDISAIWTDVNNDGFNDLVVASGGNEFYSGDKNLLPRLYLNDRKGNLTKYAQAFSGRFSSSSVIVPLDFNDDGYADLFVGGRAVPGEYGEIPNSFLLLNNRDDTFTDVTESYSSELGKTGFVTNAAITDINNDGRQDIIVSKEWGGITAFVRVENAFQRRDLTDLMGWWNFVYPIDIDKDGDMDLVAGNLGTNTRISGLKSSPVRMYYSDFDKNGKKEQFITYHLQGTEIPFASKSELEKQIPILKKKYLYAADFAKATPADIVGRDRLQEAAMFEANYFNSAIFINNGNLKFEVKSLPGAAQFSAFRDASHLDANADGYPDLLLVGNYYGNNVKLGRIDADYGLLLLSDGKGWFRASSLNGIDIKGQSRHIDPVFIGQRKHFVIARNNDSLVVIGTGAKARNK